MLGYIVRMSQQSWTSRLYSIFSKQKKNQNLHYNQKQMGLYVWWKAFFKDLTYLFTFIVSIHSFIQELQSIIGHRISKKNFYWSYWGDTFNERIMGFLSSRIKHLKIPP